MSDIQQLLDSLIAKGWTKAAIADELGVARYTVDRWTKGMTYPPNAVGVKLVLEQLLRRQRIPKRKRYTKNSPQP